MCQLATREQIDFINQLFSSISIMTLKEKENHKKIYKNRLPILVNRSL